MGFRIVQDAPEQKKYCDYIQNKLDIARRYGAVYDLTDEDLRIQRLYDDNRLQPVDVIKMISRVKAMEDGEQYITISKNVDFINKVTKTYHDRYTDVEGVTEIPLKITNEEGVEQSTQLQAVYTIPFTKQKARELIKRAGRSDVQFRFYTGPVTTNRPIIDPVVIGNADTFIEATWEELLLGREKKFVSSRVNRLKEVRDEMKKDAIVSVPEIDPIEELNKEETRTITNEDNGETTRLKVKAPKNN